MPRSVKRTPKEIARRIAKALMKELNIKDMDDIQKICSNLLLRTLEGGLEAELDEKLELFQVHYRNKRNQ